jgi:hypothetical protein
MNSRGRAFTYRLCGAVDPSVRKPALYAAEIEGMSFDLRHVYIAEDDLGFINQCTHQWDEYAASMHREPYHSVAVSNSGQTFIVSLDHEPVCVAEVHHALQYYAGEEFVPKERDYLIRLFFSHDIPLNVHGPSLDFFTRFCGQFDEVGGIVVKAEIHEVSALIDLGFTAISNKQGQDKGYYYLDLQFQSKKRLH